MPRNASPAQRVVSLATQHGFSAEIAWSRKLCRETVVINGHRCAVHILRNKRGTTTVTRGAVLRFGLSVIIHQERTFIVPAKVLLQFLGRELRRTLYLYSGNSPVIAYLDRWNLLRPRAELKPSAPMPERKRSRY
jgi:hypothetical protein